MAEAFCAPVGAPYRAYGRRRGDWPHGMGRHGPETAIGRQRTNGWYIPCPNPSWPLAARFWPIRAFPPHYPYIPLSPLTGTTRASPPTCAWAIPQGMVWHLPRGMVPYHGLAHPPVSILLSVGIESRQCVLSKTLSSEGLSADSMGDGEAGTDAHTAKVGGGGGPGDARVGSVRGLRDH